MKPALPGMLRMIAILLWIGGVVLGMLDAYGAARAPVLPGESLASRLPAVAEAVAMVLGLVGLGAVTYAIAEMIGVEPGIELKRELAELQNSMRRLESAVQRLSDQQREALAHNSGEAGVADTVAGASPGASESMQQVMTLLQEIRELSLLSESQKQERLADARQHRENFLLTEAQRLLELKEWTAAQSALSSLEREYPKSPNLEKMKSRLNAGKQEAQTGAIGPLRERVEDLMAVWAWDQAYAEAARFVEKFPDHAEGRDLLRRVMSERETYVESTANRLYEEIKRDIDRRMWRRALGSAVKLLECAPGHKRSAAIRGQLKTIRQNAEIEERQEQERRIEELIRGKQFFDAIDLAEDLLERFPNSPQAETLKNLLPKMRELAMGDEAEAKSP
jgi:hypothetical protein